MAEHSRTVLRWIRTPAGPQRRDSTPAPHFPALPIPQLQALPPMRPMQPMRPLQPMRPMQPMRPLQLIAHSAAPGFTSDAADTAKENRDSGREGTVSEPETDYLPPVISVREGIMRITLPPESGFLLRWSSVTEE